MKKLFLVIIIAIFPHAASAQFWDGNKLHQFCTEKYASYNDAIALGYIAAVTDTIITFKEINGLPQDIICLPAGVTVGQVKDIVCKGLAVKPEERHMSASSLSAKYLIQAFPCK